jgi:hypothetical protein
LLSLASRSSAANRLSLIIENFWLLKDGLFSHAIGFFEVP